MVFLVCRSGFCNIDYSVGFVLVGFGGVVLEGSWSDLVDEVRV